MPLSGSGASSSSEALGAFDADASSCSLDDPVSAWRKTGDCKGTILAGAGAVAVAVADDDTETTTKRRPVQRPLGPQTGATLRAQAARGPHLRAIDAHRLMRTALLSQSVIDALAGTTRGAGLVIVSNCQTPMALGRAAVADSAVDSRNWCIRGD